MTNDQFSSSIINDQNSMTNFQGALVTTNYSRFTFY